MTKLSWILPVMAGFDMNRTPLYTWSASLLSVVEEDAKLILSILCFLTSLFVLREVELKTESCVIEHHCVWEIKIEKI